jgi:hypothetical protein
MNALPPAGRLPTRTNFGILIFVFCCLLSSARLLRDAPNPLHLRVDDISARSDQRFAELKAQLPERGVIGYIGEAGNSGTADYYLAQYALAPLVIDHSATHALVIGSFPDSQVEVPNNLQLIKDFGNGVLLFAAKDAQ